MPPAPIQVTRAERGREARKDRAERECALRRELARYAAMHDGRFLLYGSSARGEARTDSDVDLVVDFPPEREVDAERFVEAACRRHALTPDVQLRRYCRDQFLARIAPDIVALGASPGYDGERCAKWAHDTGPLCLSAGRITVGIPTMRWALVMANANDAEYHFHMAIDLAKSLDGGHAPLDRFTTTLAFTQAMQLGHSCMESALRRVLAHFDDPLPERERTGVRLIARAARVMPGCRPALIDDELASCACRTYRARRIAGRASARMGPARVVDAIGAAGVIAKRLGPALHEFRRAVIKTDIGRSNVDEHGDPPSC